MVGTALVAALWGNSVETPNLGVSTEIKMNWLKLFV